MSDSMSTERAPPTTLMQNRLDELTAITVSTVTASSYGGGVFVLQARDNEFLGDTFRSLKGHDFIVQKHLDGDLYVEKYPGGEQ
jgi:hypothetical protein